MERINVGNIHYTEGKRQIAKTVSVDEADIAAFRGLNEAGVACYIRAYRQNRHRICLNCSEDTCMEISLLQAIALGLVAFIAGLDLFNGLTHIHRPVVLGPVVGLILGDLNTGS